MSEALSRQRRRFDERRMRKATNARPAKNAFRRLIVLVEARSRALTALEAAKNAKVSPELAAEAFEHYVGAQQRLVAYASRGHGKGRFEPQHNRQAMRSKYRPHQGKREMARRRMQMFDVAIAPSLRMAA